MELIGFAAVVVLAVIWMYVKRNEAHEQEAHVASQAALLFDTLMAKYRDATIVERIVAKTVWQGETVAMVIDSFGPPHATQERVFKTKVRRTFKYEARSRNRWAIQIHLEDERVVGWDLR